MAGRELEQCACLWWEIQLRVRTPGFPGADSPVFCLPRFRLHGRAPCSAHLQNPSAGTFTLPPKQWVSRKVKSKRKSPAHPELQKEWSNSKPQHHLFNRHQPCDHLQPCNRHQPWDHHQLFDRHQPFNCHQPFNRHLPFNCCHHCLSHNLSVQRKLLLGIVVSAAHLQCC